MRETILRMHVWLVATLIPLLVKFLDIPALLRLAEFPGRWHPYVGIPAETIAGIVDRRLANPCHMRRRRCLRQGLTFFHFLHLAGIPAEITFGALGPATPGRRMHAHCWVTVNGVAFDPPVGPVAVLFTHRYQPERSR